MSVSALARKVVRIMKGCIGGLQMAHRKTESFRKVLGKQQINRFTAGPLFAPTLLSSHDSFCENRVCPSRKAQSRNVTGKIRSTVHMHTFKKRRRKSPFSPDTEKTTIHHKGFFFLFLQTTSTGFV